MKRIYFMAMAILCTLTMSAQQKLKIKLIQADTREPLIAASVLIEPVAKTIVTDTAGIASVILSPGNYSCRVTYVGMQPVSVSFTIPFSGDMLEVEMKREEEEEEEVEVIIQSTRTSRTIRNVPTRIEAIEMEEIDEKSNMRPANVAMLLHESTGIQVQQTSATSANASIRIQGLDGRYTQLLKDGIASFGNFAAGLSVLEIPPLDLKQVEIIKGPASPLFGGGAIAGVINFVSRTPKTIAEHNLILNQSVVGQRNLGFFMSRRGARTGYTMLALLNNQSPYDVDKDDFTEIPKTTEMTLHPKLFIYPDESSTIIIGNSFSKATRKGGDVQAVKGKADSYHRYIEKNRTLRNITTVEWQRKTGGNKFINLKQGFSLFNRSIQIPDYHFEGTSYNSFSDFSFLVNLRNHSVVSGINLVYDQFREGNNSAGKRDNRSFTAGAYIQDTWDASEKIKLESGARIDYASVRNNQYSNSELFVLPRISLLINFNSHFSSRIGGGLGYKLPTLFTERTEALQYQGLLQLENVSSEKSAGTTADINYKQKVNANLEISVNQLFFYTRIGKPLVMEQSVSGISFVNSSKPVHSKGFETNMKFIYREAYKLFLGYTFTDAKATYLQGNQFLPLVPRHKLNSALIWEKERQFKMGLEAYYTSPQYLYNGFRTDDYWELGFMAEKIWKHFSVYINFENFTDTRQSRYKRVVNDPHSNPSFDDIWTHTEGFVVNGGIKIKW